MRNRAFIAASPIVLCLCASPPVPSHVVVAPPGYAELVGCWVGIRAGTLFRLCLAADSTATLRYEWGGALAFFWNELTEITVSSGVLEASIRGDAYPEPARVKGTVDHSSIELRLPKGPRFRRLVVEFAPEDYVEGQWRRLAQPPR